MFYKKEDESKLIEKKLLKSIINGDIEQVRYCLMKGVNPNCLSDKNEFAISLIQYAPVHTINGLASGKPFQIIRLKNHYAIVRCLVEYGANFNVLDKNGYSVIDLANLHSEWELVTYLKNKKALYSEFKLRPEVKTGLKELFSVLQLCSECYLEDISVEGERYILILLSSNDSVNSVISRFVNHKFNKSEVSSKSDAELKMTMFFDFGYFELNIFKKHKEDKKIATLSSKNYDDGVVKILIGINLL